MGRKFSSTVIVVFLSCAFAICLTNFAQAFDGKRKGFVLGGGAGYCPLTYQGGLGSTIESFREDYNYYDTVRVYVVLGPEYVSSTRTSVAFQIDLGYGWDNQNIVFIRNQHSFYRTNYYLSQGVSAVCWSHYFGIGERSLYSTVGLGFFSKIDWSHGGSTAGYDNGLSMLVGIGYQFRRHLSLDLNFSQGPINSGLGRCSNLILALSATAF